MSHVESWSEEHFPLAKGNTNIHTVRRAHTYIERSLSLSLSHRGTLAVQLVTEQMSRGSAVAERGRKRVREGKKSQRSRNLWGRAIKKPVLNYRSSLPLCAWVNPWCILLSFKNAWNTGGAFVSMMYGLQFKILSYDQANSHRVIYNDAAGSSCRVGAEIYFFFFFVFTAGLEMIWNTARFHPA